MKLLAILLMLVIPALAMAQQPNSAPVVRTLVDPADGIVIGQPVQIHVEVLFPGEMPHPPLVRVPEAPGAQILRFETQATTIRDRLAGQDYVGQRFEFVVFPRRGGEIAISAPEVTLLDRGGDPAGSAKGEAIRISASVPAGLDASGPVLAADKVTASESWSPDPGTTGFKAGGAITRTIRRQAAGVPALGMAEFRFTAPGGVRVYVDPPVVEDRSNRGIVDGARVDKATYVFERAGSYALPELSQPWWNLAEKQARTETLPGLTVSVVAPDGRPAEPPRRSRLLWLAALVAAVLLSALILIRSRLSAAWQGWLQRRQASEAFARRTLLREARSGEPASIYRALGTWLGRLPPVARARVHADARLGPLIAGLEGALFSAEGNWEPRRGADLAQALANFSATSANATPARNLLPPLNPVYLT
ncbi:hypothetical protein LJR090_004293 [Bosea sp. LjRoot90]|uniref:hypothetical protein n=1 Tax=Bosea sp. LjRoot90 TaxID=3342342 RepID=UPI003ECD6AF6